MSKLLSVIGGPLGATTLVFGVTLTICVYYITAQYGAYLVIKRNIIEKKFDRSILESQINIAKQGNDITEKEMIELMNDIDLYI
ncbi:MAG: hypothetical protein H0X03_08235 [Nitrosopumilus sp.]|nr:hypothetical protein [Nitrosopumilus sp.]